MKFFNSKGKEMRSCSFNRWCANNAKFIFFASIACFVILSSCDKNDRLDAVISDGKHYIEKFEFDKAINLFSKAIKANKNNAALYYWLGESFRKKLFYLRFRELSNTEEEIFFNNALDAYNNSIELNPRDSNPRSGLAQLYLWNKDYKNSILNFKIALSIAESKDKIAIYQSMGDVYLKLGQNNIANEYFKLSKKDFGEEIESELKEAVIHDRIQMGGYSVALTSYLSWGINDRSVYDHKVGSAKYANTILTDIYNANLLTKLRTRNFDSSENSIESAIPAIIMECNNGKLREFGLVIHDIQIALGGRTTTGGTDQVK